MGKIKLALILIGVPVGLFWVVGWVANQPDPTIRRFVAQKAPILLLPSYRSMESEYRQALTSVEQADQLVNNATSAADLDLGEQKVKEAQKHLDSLPIDFLTAWPEYRSWWYDWRFNIYQFQADRQKIGQLGAKVFQEKNAQTLLFNGEQALNTAKQQYQQASTTTDKQIAIASWQAAIDQLEQITSETLAGKTAQKKLEAYKRDFKEIVGLAAGNERISTLIEGARQFSAQAAIASQNPPHTVAQWQQVESLWQEAITRLEQIPAEDLAGYAEAQKLLAQDQYNLGQIQIRRKAEADSVAALEQAQSQIQSFQASTPTDAKSLDRNRTISQLQGIINQLEKVQSGTTAYLKAQELLLSAKNSLKQLQQ
ncbi:MAG: hypothetical protein KME08_00120 [Aphanothece sp. CMT-3BRIN-NPC111]|nr:hypothetical protein [Aphanothece sp. CMT-3BRIN-NPC111]